MRPSELLKTKRQEIKEIINRYNVTNPRVFGSVLSGTDAEGSDLDLLVDILPNTTYMDIGGLQVDLTEFLDIEVDVLTAGAIHKKFRQEIIDAAQPI